MPAFPATLWYNFMLLIWNDLISISPDPNEIDPMHQPR